MHTHLGWTLLHLNDLLDALGPQFAHFIPILDTLLLDYAKINNTFFALKVKITFTSSG